VIYDLVTDGSMLREMNAKCRDASLKSAVAPLRSLPRLAAMLGSLCYLIAGCGGLNSVGATQYCRLEPKSAGLALAGTVYYESDIKPLLAEHCVSCHSGATPPTLNTYQLAKLEIDKVLDSVKAGRMPKSPALPLDAGQIALLEGWKAGGLLQSVSRPVDIPSGPAATAAPSSSSDPTASSNPGATGGIDTDKNLIKCGSDLEVKDLRKSATNPLLKRDQVTICQNQGLVYDRSANVCGPAKITKDYPCTRNGIAQAFSGKYQGIFRLLDSALGKPTMKDDFGEFYTIDQCGKYDNGDPYAVLVRLVEVSKKEELQVIEIKITGSK